jgi:hypothetical protein
MKSCMKPENVRRNVARAAKALDKYDPNWRDRIDLLDLDLGVSQKCILGQLFSSCYYAPGHLQKLTAFWYGNTWNKHEMDCRVEYDTVNKVYQREWERILTS